MTHSFGSDIHLLLLVNACPKGHRFTHRFTENTTYVSLFTLIFITLETFPIFIYTSLLFITHPLVNSPSLQALLLCLSKLLLTVRVVFWFISKTKRRCIDHFVSVILIGF